MTYPPLSDSSSSDAESESSNEASDDLPLRKPKPATYMREKKRKKPSSIPIPVARVAGQEGEGMHVCVTCGRTDSPEWRKGPLGPKTLCNVRRVFRAELIRRLAD